MDYRATCLFVIGLIVAVALLPAATADAHGYAHKGCAQTATQPPLLGHYWVGAGHVNCRTARRVARRAIRHGSGPRGWRCRIPASYQGSCKRGDRLVTWWGGGE